ncbi:3'-5'-bisphosphate nucleotidase [Lysobacter arseniciresistens ZS79]|uniref:3'(2'),5'-bisphosphate nucleotidase CysQ n=1 Tax=Lysobacter arseniciresistens ZS79 TaxID=913325 RepID=A0A0A0F1G7_9GAMM|nr:3'(2'),5'-bisphosphate nucleotidase CysQ [Lysobacter arseniciresistens]KGM56639.1 3'-5'-bisphosphate nucleotidase [Lysobacter arseniciresistens ZS79]
MTNDPALREGAIAVARAAAAEILKVYDSEFAVQHKGDSSPLTAADLAAHHCIVDGLARLAPDIPVLSEESSGITTAERRTWSRFWLVDPLDGTREFVKRNGEFTVNIALVEDGVATFGVVQAPVTGALWHGGATLGAFRRDGDGGDRPIATRRPPTTPLRVAASRSHRDQRSNDFIERMGETEPVGLGSSLKFCAIAQGDIDVYPRFGPTSEWDTAAAQAVLEGAGGCVLDLQGRPFRYNQRDSLLNGEFVALGDPSLPWRRWAGL